MVKRKPFPLINIKSTLSVFIKTYIYNTYIRLILTYAAPIRYSNLFSSSKLKLVRILSTTLKIITGYQKFVNNHTVKRTTKSSIMEENICQPTIRFKSSILNCPFDHITAINTRRHIADNYKLRSITFK